MNPVEKSELIIEIVVPSSQVGIKTEDFLYGDDRENSMNETNIFRHYKQTENQFTNSLFSILELSREVDKSFMDDFFSNCLHMQQPKGKLNFKVLRDQEGGHADAQISNDKLYLLVESKIESQSLEKRQIKSHLRSMKKRSQKLKRLILLTPDSDESWYIKQLRMIDKRMVLHLSWKKVYEEFNSYVAKRTQSVFVKLVSQYLHIMKERILDKNFIGAIQKINFKMTDRDYSKRRHWGERRYYSALDAPGRKLILYDPQKTALTAEWEIRKLDVDRRRSEFPYWYTLMPNSLRIYESPVPLRKIKRIERFKSFGKGRSQIRNLTQEQYDTLMKDAKADV